MSPDAILTIEKILDFCHQKWAEADQPPASDFPTSDMLTGKKMAYNDVRRFARKLVGEKA